MLKDIKQKISKLYHEYPRTFWIVIVITFIDRLGGSLFFSFCKIILEEHHLCDQRLLVARSASLN